MKNIWSDIRYGNAVAMVIRVILGAMFLFSGAIKAADTESFGRVILQYNLIPEILVPYPAIVIPYLEILLGLCLFTGYRVKLASLISALLMVFFTVIIGINVMRGETFQCGCFELNRFGIMFDERIGIPLMIRDIIFLCCFILLFGVKKHLLSLDNFLEKRALTKLS